MTHDEYIVVLRAHADAFTGAARGTPLDRRVPSCPDWRVADLVAHLGRHHRWVAANLDRGPGDGPAPARDLGSPPEGDGAIDWVAGGAEALAKRLDAVDPATPCWTWIDDQTAGFWSRRTALETAVHRWDLQNAAGAPEPFAPALAADAIDEYLSIMPFRGAAGGERGTIHLHTSDTEGEWLLRLDDDGLHLTREHAKGDVAVRGPASDLLLVVLGRALSSTVDVFGDEQLLALWLEKTRF